MFCQEHNSDYFSQYVTEPFEEYVSRKRLIQVHGNHLEIQALSELYNRPIHIYCYSPGREIQADPYTSTAIVQVERYR